MKIPNLEHLSYLALCALSDGVIIINRCGRVLFMNQAAQQLTGSEIKEPGISLDEVFFAYMKDSGQRYSPPLEGNIDTLVLPDYLLLSNIKTAAKIYISGKLSSYSDADDAFCGFVLMIQDISHLKQREIEAAYNCFNDSLTELYNRSFFEAEMKRLSSSRMLPLSVIVGDANGLKLVNDAFGHSEGDKLLKRIADIMRSVCRKEDILARTGGDEFAILLPQVGADGAELIVKRIRETCRRVDSFPIPVSISLGAATRESPDTDIWSIYRLAEERMYQAKMKEGRIIRSEIIDSICKSLEDHAEETQAHGNRIKDLALRLADRIGLSEYERSQLELLAMIHDIGKIAIPRSILSKPDKLDLDEWSIVRKHSEIGYRIAAYSPELAFLADAILSHHERWDGKGYPQGLIGRQIPLVSRIIAIIDAYDILTHGRPYRKPSAPEIALKEIEGNAGTQFDNELVSQFITMMIEDVLEQAL